MVTGLDHPKSESLSDREAKLLKQLERTQKELDDFIYIVSHDLRAPLRGIESLAGWIATDYADKLDQEGLELIELMMARVRRVQNQLDGLTQYSRIGRKRQAIVNVDLSELIRAIVEKTDIPGHVKVKIEGTLPSILGEAIRFEQIFKNLLDNALNHLDKEQGEIIITCTDADEYWQFSISDNGCGLEENHFERIFKIFQTLQPVDAGERIGVGLSLVKKIIRMYHGDIWLESEVGVGSTFHFTLLKKGLDEQRETRI